MSDNFLQMPKTSKVKDEFALKKDKKKAYQIFFLSFVCAAGLTALMLLI